MTNRKEDAHVLSIDTKKIDDAGWRGICYKFEFSRNFAWFRRFV